jgi:hypothetical protein
VAEGPASGDDRHTPAEDATTDGDASASTVGTGSVLGIGCLIVVVVLVLLALAYRSFGGSW